MVVEHPYPFDPTYGYDEAALRAVGAPPEPEGYAEFWTGTYRETLAVAPRVERRAVAGGAPGFEVFEIEFDGFAGFRVGGWLTVPKTTPVFHGLIAGHGYGGRTEPSYSSGAVTLAPCARGFDRSARPELPGEALHHVVHGIESREGYLLRGCAADLWAAASALLALFPEVAGRLHYGGTSFGGGLGALALAWDGRFAKAFLEVPTFGNHPLRVTLPCVGSGAAVRSRWRRRPEVLEVLAFYDAATAARRIAVPVLAAPALFDPVVPPPGQWAVANALAGPREFHVLPTGHFDTAETPSIQAGLQRRVFDWWREA